MLPALKGRRDLAETIITNLNNHVIGYRGDETGREMAADLRGKIGRWNKSRSFSGKDSSVTVKRELRHIFTHRDLHAVAAVQVHCVPCRRAMGRGVHSATTDADASGCRCDTGPVPLDDFSQVGLNRLAGHKRSSRNDSKLSCSVFLLTDQ